MTKQKLLNLIIEIVNDKLTGGVGDSTDVSSLDKNQLLIGTKVEFEHTNDKEIAREIAIDHLTEVPDYYTKLIKAGLVDEKSAIELYNKIYKNKK